MATASLILSMIVIGTALFRPSICDENYMNLDHTDVLNKMSKPRFTYEDDASKEDNYGTDKRSHVVLEDTNHMLWSKSRGQTTCNIISYQVPHPSRIPSIITHKKCVNIDSKKKHLGCQYGNLVCEQRKVNMTVAVPMQIEVNAGCVCRKGF